MPLPLKICSAPSSDLVHLNLVYVGHGVFNPAVRYVKLQDHVFGVCPHQSIAPTDIALNTIQRRSCKVSPGDSINVEPFTLPTQKFTLDSLNIEIDFVVKKNMTVKIDGTAFIDVFRTRYSNQVCRAGAGRPCASRDRDVRGRSRSMPRPLHCTTRSAEVEAIT